MTDVIIFTDLDGTLLDHESYGVRAALPTIDLSIRRGFPIIPVSSKTAAEIRRWVRLLTLDGPFICENGCGIVIPDGYFEALPAEAVRRDGEWRISLGVSIDKVRGALETLSEEAHFDYKSMNQMSTDEVSTLTGLTGVELLNCLEREYDEPFIINGDHEFDPIRRKSSEMGFHLTRGGRFYHLTGGCNKGEAVRKMVDMFRKYRTDPLFVAIGDSFNDLPMFGVVDMAYLVQKPDGNYDPLVPAEAARRVPGVGPCGWRIAVEEVMNLG